MSASRGAIERIRRALEESDALRRDCEDAGCKLRLPSSRERSHRGIVDLCLACGEDLAANREGERAVDRIVFIENREAPTHLMGLVELKAKTVKPSELREKFAASHRRASRLLRRVEAPDDWAVRGVVAAKQYKSSTLKQLREIEVGGRRIKLEKSGAALLDAL